jgi:putative peptidoglycan lipid II flippase
MSLARDISTVGIGTLVSRLFAYTRDAAIAALLGTGPFSEAFFVVLQGINFFRRLLAEGALNGAFVPIWLRLASGEDGIANANRFTIRTLLTVGIATGALALIVVTLARSIVIVFAHGFAPGQQDLTAFYLMLAAPYIVVSALVAVLSAALYAEQRVIAVTASTAVFNMVLVGLLSFIMTRDIAQFTVGAWLAMTVVGAGLLQFLITAVVWLAGGARFRRARVRVRDQAGAFFARALPGLIASGVPQLKLIAATALVSASPAAVSWLYYANRLYELPLGVASITIAAVIVPRIAASVNVHDSAAYAHAQSRAYEIALGVALPATTGFALLAPQIAGGLFEHGLFGARDTDAVATAVLAICSGLPGHVLEKVFGAVSFAHEDTKTPMLTALSGLGAAVVGGIALFPAFDYVGVAAAIALSAWVGAALLGFALYRRGWLRLDATAARNLPRIAGATVLMGAAVAAGLAIVDLLLPMLAASAVGRLLIMFALVAIGVAAYAAVVDRLGVAKFTDLAAAIRRRG